MHYNNRLHGDVILKAKRIKIIFFVPKLNLLLYSLLLLLLLRILKVHRKYHFPERVEAEKCITFVGLVENVYDLQTCNTFVLNVQYELISSEAEQSLQTSTVVFRNKAHFGKPVTEKPKTFILGMFVKYAAFVSCLYWYICAIQQ